VIDKEATYNQIEKYLNKEFSANETILFEKRVANEPDLAAQVNEMQEVNDLLLDKFLLEEKELMKQFDYQSSTDSGKHSSKWWLGLFLLTGTLTVFFFSQQKNKESNITQTIEKVESRTLKKEQTSITIAEPTFTNVQKKAKQNPDDKSGIVIIAADSNQQAISTFDSIPLPSIVNSPQKKRTRKAGTACDTVTISFQITETKPCTNQYNGELMVSSISGGTNPYFIHWKHDSINNDSIIVNLYSGMYTLEVTDSAQCTTTKTIVLEDSLCKAETIRPNLKLSFSRSFEEGVLLPNFDNKNYKITIINKKGVQVFERNMTDCEQYIWTGETNGEILPVGYYIAIFKVENQAYKGSISIIP
jgi:hypothetical protein